MWRCLIRLLSLGVPPESIAKAVADITAEKKAAHQVRGVMGLDIVTFHDWDYMAFGLDRTMSWCCEDFYAYQSDVS